MEGLKKVEKGGRGPWEAEEEEGEGEEPRETDEEGENAIYYK